MESRTLSRQRDKRPPTHTTIPPARTHKTRHEEAELSFPLCRRTTTSSQRIALSLLACLVGKRLEMWLFLEPLRCVCVYLLISHQWGEAPAFVPFLTGTWHTASPSFLALIHHKFWAACFLAACSLQLRNGFRHFHTSRKKGIIVFINSCRRDSPTQADPADGRTGKMKRCVYDSF